MTDLQQDIESVQKLVDAEALLPAKQAWQRIRASLSPDRERVWRAIRNTMNRNGGKPITNDQWMALADAAIAAVQRGSHEQS